MNSKKNKIIIAIGVLIIVAATVLIITVVDSMGDDEPTGYNGPYTLQPTTTPSTAVDTSSWININDIAASATATDTSGVSDTGAVITTGVQGYFFDNFGNLVDGKGNIVIPAGQWGNGGTNQQNSPSNLTTEKPTYIDNTEALDEPVTNGGELGEFEIDDKGIITKYLGDKESVLIPQKEQGKLITGIGDNCFYGSSIKAIYIPATVTYIGNSAFENCTRLATVSFDSSSTQVILGTNAFKNCVALKSVNLPIITNMGGSVFDKCTSLETVRFSEGSKKISSYAFADCVNLSVVDIPVSVDYIGLNAFLGFNPDKLNIITPMDSTAWEYAVKNGIKHNTHE